MNKIKNHAKRVINFFKISEKGLAKNLKQQQANNKKIGQEVLLKNFQVIFILKKKE